MTDYIRTPIDFSLAQVAKNSSLNEIFKLGKSLPCSVVEINNALVKVNFEITTSFPLPQVWVPIAEWAYARAPVQIGDLGVTRPSDVFIGGVSGQGTGTATLNRQGNLTNLIFEPISNSNWPVAPDTNAFCIKGYNTSGAVISSGDGHCVLTINTNGLSLKINGNVVAQLGASGLTITNGDVVADTISLKSHLTSGVQSGSGVSSIPIPP